MRSRVVTGADTKQPWAAGRGGAETRAGPTPAPWRRFYSEPRPEPPTQGRRPVRGWVRTPGPFPGRPFPGGVPGPERRL